jgi:hypothetical protein
VDEFELKRIIYDYIKEICHYSQMQVFATSSYQKNYFQLQIEEAINGLINLIMEYHRNSLYETQAYSIQQQQNINPSQADLYQGNPLGQETLQAFEEQLPEDEYQGDPMIQYQQTTPRQQPGQSQLQPEPGQLPGQNQQQIDLEQ